MAGLPKLPGLSFADPTKTKFNLIHQFDFKNGYRFPKRCVKGTGNTEIDVNSVEFINLNDTIRFDPSLTYGRARTTIGPLFVPHFATYDQKCLTFRAFFKQTVPESPDEHFRIRQVNIIYFLEDDTITVMEPPVENSGIMQGRLVRRGKIPKTDKGDYWHWKDLNVGKDIAIFGIVYHTVDTDTYTREYMASQGIEINPTEDMPPDPYILNRKLQAMTNTHKSPGADNKLRRFLEYDGKVLKFEAVWDDRNSEFGEMRCFKILYFLSDDTIAVKEVHERNDGRDPYPVLLRKQKLPKVWTDMPADFPSAILERTDAEVAEYYQPKDLLVGDTIFVLGRRFLLYDCDHYTRIYFKKVLNITQRAAIEVKEKPSPIPIPPMPPHDGIGSLEDSLQSCLTFMPKTPKKDVVRQVLNANHMLRYEMEMDWVHPEDSIRRFVLFYSLSEGTCKIQEPPIRNSGIIGGTFLSHTLIIKPGSDPLNPDYYTPADFYIGALITVFKHRFRIIGADLHVYRYMQSNVDKFAPEVIENIRNYMFNIGLLKDDIKDQIAENYEEEKVANRAAQGKDTITAETDMEKCLASYKIREPTAEELKRKADLIQSYEDSLKHTYKVPPHGILPVEKECQYPPVIGDVPSTVCKEPPPGVYDPRQDYEVETDEDRLRQYYQDVLRRHREACDQEFKVTCAKPDRKGKEIERAKDGSCADYPTEAPRPILLSPPIMLDNGICKKQVTFAPGPDRCQEDRYDLCHRRLKKNNCDCTDFKQ